MRFYIYVNNCIVYSTGISSYYDLYEKMNESNSRKKSI